jgi:hypothetical protein
VPNRSSLRRTVPRRRLNKGGHRQPPFLSSITTDFKARFPSSPLHFRATGVARFGTIVQPDAGNPAGRIAAVGRTVGTGALRVFPRQFLWAPVSAAGLDGVNRATAVPDAFECVGAQKEPTIRLRKFSILATLSVVGGGARRRL